MASQGGYRLWGVVLSAVVLVAPVSARAADNLDAFKRQFAQAVYDTSPELVHDRQPQPLLRAVVVLNIRLSEDRHWVADVMRANRSQPEMLSRALQTVERVQLGESIEELPADVRQALMRDGINETWLFDNDGTFQVMTLAKPQRTSF